MINEIAVLVSRFPFSMAARSRLGLIKPTDKIITQKNIYLFQFNNYGSSLFDSNLPVRLYQVGDRQAGRASGFGFQIKAEVENPISLLHYCTLFSASAGSFLVGTHPAILPPGQRSQQHVTNVDNRHPLTSSAVPFCCCRTGKVRYSSG